MSDEKKVMCHVFLVGYAHDRGFGSLINYREIGKTTARPSADDLDSMMEKVANNAGIRVQSLLVLSVSELQDQMVPISMASGYHEDIARD